MNIINQKLIDNAKAAAKNSINWTCVCGKACNNAAGMNAHLREMKGVDGHARK